MFSFFQLPCFLSYLSITISLFDVDLFPLTFHVDSPIYLLHTLLPKLSGRSGLSYGQPLCHKVPSSSNLTFIGHCFHQSHKTLLSHRCGQKLVSEVTSWINVQSHVQPGTEYCKCIVLQANLRIGIKCPLHQGSLL